MPDFIRDAIDRLRAEHPDCAIQTRFPPEPNGYLHIGHAKAICLNFEIAREYDGKCVLRFDDTNPATEDTEYCEAIFEDVKWLGYTPHSIRYASDYFPALYALALDLIEADLAYVEELSEAEIREYRGTVKTPGKPSPFRDRTRSKNHELFRAMAKGGVAEGEMVLRLKGDLSSPNMKMRDPLIYRVKSTPHHRTGTDWYIYPFYDFAHPLSDAIEGVTHSLCTLEFQNNRPLYDRYLELTHAVPVPVQMEMARFEMTYTVTSKRKLKELVDSGAVDGWSDPRLPTLAGLRRRGVPPTAITALMARVGVSKANSTIPAAWLEDEVRRELNITAPRAMAVLDPLEIVLTNYEGEELFPTEDGSREVPFGKRIYIERRDFMLEPVRKFKRLAPGVEVRLKRAYLITCNEVEYDADGEVSRLLCTVDLDSRGGMAADGRKVRGTVHWVSADHAVDMEVRLYDRLFNVEAPGKADDIHDALNPDSVKTITAKCEPHLATFDGTVQFEREGYFASENGGWNRVSTLRDTWARR